MLVQGSQNVLRAVALFEDVYFAAKNNRQAKIALTDLEKNVAALQVAPLCNGFKQRQLMIVQLGKGYAFSISIKLFVSVFFSHVITLRATQHIPNRAARI